MSINDDETATPSDEEAGRATDMDEAVDVEDYRSADKGSEKMDSVFDELDGDGVNPRDVDGEGDADR